MSCASIPSASQQALYRLRNELQITLVAHPALLEHIIELRLRAAVMIEHVGADRVGAEKPRRHILAPDAQRRGAITGQHFLGAAGAGQRPVGGDHQRRLTAAQRVDQRTGARALRTAHVASMQRRAEVECRGDHRCVLAVQERHRGRCKQQLANPFGFVLATQRCAGGSNAHRDAVLIETAIGARAPALQIGKCPAMGTRDRTALEPQPRHIRTEGCNADIRHRSTLRSTRASAQSRNRARTRIVRVALRIGS